MAHRPHFSGISSRDQMKMPAGCMDQNWKCYNTFAHLWPEVSTVYCGLWLFSNQAYFHDTYIISLIKNQPTNQTINVAKYVCDSLQTGAIVMLFLSLLTSNHLSSLWLQQSY